MRDLTPTRLGRACTYIFIALQAVLFPLIQLLPAGGSACFSYIAIILAAGYAVLTYFTSDRGGMPVRLGLFFTLGADWFLVICDERELEGVVFFTAVQMCYFIYLMAREDSTRVRIFNAVSRIVLIGAVLSAAYAVLGDGLDALATVSILYYCNLVVNTVFAFVDFSEMRVLAVGLLLFCLCDLCIGLDVMASEYLDIPALDGVFYGRYYNLPWVFYQPSQTLIALHLYYDNRRTRRDPA